MMRNGRERRGSTGRSGCARGRSRGFGLALVMGSLLLSGADDLVAQERGREGGRERVVERGMRARMDTLQTRIGRILPPRLRLGVALEEAKDEAGRVEGVRVNRVLPESPALAAGLREGDVIMQIDGRSLLEGDPREGEAITRLTDRTRRLAPGDTVRLGIRRDGQALDVTLVAGDLPGSAGLPPVPRIMAFGSPEGRDFLRDFRWGVEGRTLGATLLDLTPELGAYFGVDEGVLVTVVDEDAPLPLRAGDVLLRIDGREVADARHAREILGSYRSGESVSIQVRRQGRTESLEARIP